MKRLLFLCLCVPMLGLAHEKLPEWFLNIPVSPDHSCVYTIGISDPGLSKIEALEQAEADKDANGIVSTDELRIYVSEQVVKASGDLQHPTVDRDNIYQKFGFNLH